MQTVRPDLHLAGVATSTLDEIARGRTGFNVIGDPNARISGIAYDSREVKPGDLFVALVGGYFDGHDFANAALNKGAAALLVERPLDIPIPQIVVGNTRAALAPVAARYFGHPSREMDVIGVTGTDGKTTTSCLIESIFEHAGFRTGVMGTIAVRVGEEILDTDTRQTTPESVDVQRHLRAMVDHGAKAAIVEATSHGLDLHRLDGVEFKTGAVTSITHEHLEHHKTIAAYRRAKARLFEALASFGGNAIINLDDEGSRTMLAYAKGASVRSYGIENVDADVRASDIVLSSDGTRYLVEAGGGGTDVTTGLVGRFNVENALCAIAVALSHDISLETCAQALSTVSGVPGRMQPVLNGQPFSVMVDYAHTPDSVEKVLNLMRSLTKGRLILVMGSAGERDETKRPIQGNVGARLADFCVFTTEDPRFEDPDAIIADIAAGARASEALEGRDYVCITDRREAISYALARAQPGDSVVLAGKGHEQSIIWGHEKRPWNEVCVATEILEQLGYRQDTP